MAYRENCNNAINVGERIWYLFSKAQRKNAQKNNNNIKSTKDLYHELYTNLVNYDAQYTRFKEDLHEFVYLFEIENDEWEPWAFKDSFCRIPDECNGGCGLLHFYNRMILCQRKALLPRGKCQRDLCNRVHMEPRGFAERALSVMLFKYRSRRYALNEPLNKYQIKMSEFITCWRNELKRKPFPDSVKEDRFIWYKLLKQLNVHQIKHDHLLIKTNKVQKNLILWNLVFDHVIEDYVIVMQINESDLKMRICEDSARNLKCPSRCFRDSTEGSGHNHPAWCDLLHLHPILTHYADRYCNCTRYHYGHDMISKAYIAFDEPEFSLLPHIKKRYNEFGLKQKKITCTADGCFCNIIKFKENQMMLQNRWQNGWNIDFDAVQSVNNIKLIINWVQKEFENVNLLIDNYHKGLCLYYEISDYDNWSKRFQDIYAETNEQYVCGCLISISITIITLQLICIEIRKCSWLRCHEDYIKWFANEMMKYSLNKYMKLCKTRCNVCYNGNGSEARLKIELHVDMNANALVDKLKSCTLNACYYSKRKQIIFEPKRFINKKKSNYVLSNYELDVYDDNEYDYSEESDVDELEVTNSKPDANYKHDSIDKLDSNDKYDSNNKLISSYKPDSTDKHDSNDTTDVKQNDEKLTTKQNQYLLDVMIEEKKAIEQENADREELWIEDKGELIYAVVNEYMLQYQMNSIKREFIDNPKAGPLILFIKEKNCFVSKEMINCEWSMDILDINDKFDILIDCLNKGRDLIIPAWTRDEIMTYYDKNRNIRHRLGFNTLSFERRNQIQQQLKKLEDYAKNKKSKIVNGIWYPKRNRFEDLKKAKQKAADLESKIQRMENEVNNEWKKKFDELNAEMIKKDKLHEQEKVEMMRRWNKKIDDLNKEIKRKDMIHEQEKTKMKKQIDQMKLEQKKEIEEMKIALKKEYDFKINEQHGKLLKQQKEIHNQQKEINQMKIKQDEMYNLFKARKDKQKQDQKSKSSAIKNLVGKIFMNK